MKARDRDCPFFLPGLQFCYKPFKVADGAIYASVPQPPLHRPDVPVDGWDAGSMYRANGATQVK